MENPITFEELARFIESKTSDSGGPAHILIPFASYIDLWNRGLTRGMVKEGHLYFLGCIISGAKVAEPEIISGRFFG